MHLLHRTNYWGTTIDWTDRDDEVDMHAIWVQAMTRRRASCCPGFGKRRVGIKISDLIECHSGLWNLYFVSETEGRNSDHFFTKLVLLPQGTKGFGKEHCRKVLGWKYKNQWDVTAESAMGNLKTLLEDYHTKDGYERCHVHIGIHMESCDVGRGHSS